MHLKPEEWISHAQSLSMAGVQVGSFLARQNYKGRGKEDADELLETVLIACAAMFFASQHADEAIVPLEGEKRLGLYWCNHCKYTEALSRNDIHVCPVCNRPMSEITEVPEP